MGGPLPSPPYAWCSSSPSRLLLSIIYRSREFSQFARRQVPPVPLMRVDLQRFGNFSGYPTSSCFPAFGCMSTHWGLLGGIDEFNCDPDSSR